MCLAGYVGNSDSCRSISILAYLLFVYNCSLNRSLRASSNEKRRRMSRLSKIDIVMSWQSRDGWQKVQLPKMVSMQPHRRQKPRKVPIKLEFSFRQVNDIGPPKVLTAWPVNVHSVRLSIISRGRGGSVSCMVTLSTFIWDDTKRCLISIGVILTHCRQSRLVSERRNLGWEQVGLTSGTTILLSSLILMRMLNSRDSQEPVNSQGAPDTSRI